MFYYIWIIKYLWVYIGDILIFGKVIVCFIGKIGDFKFIK